MAKEKDGVTAAPLVTVIVPMYNAEQYIGQCLQALVSQTFQDFEVIVVNDCSTDNSVAEVQKFIPKFNGRLRLKSLTKNSGCSSVPKNTGIPLARGKYVTFCDSDDYFSPTAIEELVKIAEATDAEVVHASHYYSFKDGETEIRTGTFQRKYFVDKPTLETADIGERVKKFTEYGFLWWGQCKIIRKDFLMKYDIRFPPVSVWEDLVFVFMCVVHAKNYVRIPNIFYYYRVREDSLSHIPKDPFDIVDTLMKVMNFFDDFMGKIEFFKKNPAYRFMLLDWHIQGRMNIICAALYDQGKLQPYYVDRLFFRKFAEKIPKEQISFASYFFTIAAYQRSYIAKMTTEKNQLQQKISELEMSLARYKVNSFLK